MISLSACYWIIVLYADACWPRPLLSCIQLLVVDLHLRYSWLQPVVMGWALLHLHTVPQGQAVMLTALGALCYVSILSALFYLALEPSAVEVYCADCLLDILAQEAGLPDWLLAVKCTLR